MRAEFFHFLVQSKTRRVSGDFEEHAAGFSEVDGMKIRALDYWRDVVTKVDQTLAPPELFGFVLRSKRDVMHRPSCDAAHCGIGLTEQVNNSPWRRVILRDEAESISGFINPAIAEG